MTAWKEHIVWAIMLSVALLLLALGESFLDIALSKSENTLARTNKEIQQNKTSLEQINKDKDEAKTLRRQIDAKGADAILAPSDRVKTSQMIEGIASEFMLSSFSYSISPEQAEIIALPASGKQRFAKSVITIDAFAPTDLEIYGFIASLQKTIAGGFTLTELQMEKTEQKKIELSGANIRAHINGIWLSNGNFTATITDKNP